MTATPTFEAKKDRLVQTQDGLWKMTFTVHPNDMPTWLLTAPMGQRLGVAAVPITEDSEIAASREDGPSCPSGIGTPPESAQSVAPAASKTRKPPIRFGELRPSAQAALRCKDEDFQYWLGADGEDDAAVTVRKRCGVLSRSEIDTNPEAAAKWKRLNDQFETRNYDAR